MTEENKVLWEVEEEPAKAAPEPEAKEAEKAEGEKPDPQKEFGKRAEQRIRQLVRKAKTAEETAREAAARAARFEEELGSLKETVARLQQGGVAQTKEQLQQKYTTARARYLQAREAGNTADEVAAMEAMQQANAQWTAMQNAPAPRETQKEKREEVRQEAPGLNPKAKSWIDGKEWWETDPIARGAAIAVASKLDGEGWDPDDDGYYEEVDRLMAGRFPDLYGVKETEKKPAPKAEEAQVRQTVAGGSRTSQTQGGSNKVRLSASEVKLANKMRIPLERYAAEKLKMQQATTQDGRVLPVEIDTRRS